MKNRLSKIYIWLFLTVVFFLTACPINNDTIDGNNIDDFQIEKLTDLAIGGRNACAIYDKSVYCWGEFIGFSIADNILLSDIEFSNPSRIFISSGGARACVIDLGVIKCWGYDPGNIFKIPTQIKEPSEIVFNSKVMCSQSLGVVECWGSDDNQLGIDFDYLDVPVLMNADKLVTFGREICASDDNGVYCWGGVTEEYISNVGSVLDISKKLDNTCVIDDGEVKCWDDWFHNPRNETPEITNAMMLSVGSNHVCIILNDGKINCWGTNEHVSEKVINNIPVVLNPTKIVSGQDFSCVIHDSGISCWGENYENQLEFPGFLNENM